LIIGCASTVCRCAGARKSPAGIRPNSFNDEQRRGPYRRWSHTHTFLDKDGGTLCRDEVVYAVPGGALVNWIFVRHDVKKIFAYRATVLKKQFDAKN